MRRWSDVLEIRKSYSFQITSILIIILALVISSLAFSADRVTISRAEQLAEDQFNYAINESIENMESHIGKLYEDLVSLGAYVNNRSLLQERVQSGYLNPKTYFTSVFYYDASRRGIDWLSPRSVEDDMILKSRSFKQSLLDDTSIHMSDPMSIGGDYGTYLFVPLRDNGETIGVFGASLSLMNSDLYRRMLESSNEDMILYLMSHSGDVLSTTFNLVTEEERRLPSSVLAFTIGQQRRQIISTKEDVYMNEPVVPVRGWTVLAKQPSDSVYASVYETRLQYLLIAMITFVLSIIAGLFLSRKLTNPLIELVQKLKKKQSLEPVTLERAGSTEVQTLLDTYNDYFNRMEHARQEQFNQQQLLLQQEKLASIGQLAAGLAHEIRNPLTPVQITLQMQKQGNVSSEMIDMSLAELSRANDLLTAMLKLSKPRNERFELTKLDMPTLVEQLKFLLNAECYERTAEWELIVSDDLPPLHSSADVIVLVLHNLFKNALDAVDSANREHGVVSVTIDTTEEYYKFIVSDNGVGMTEEQVHALGRAFKTTKDTGTGLGMYMTHEYLKSIDGKLVVNSEVGVGTMIMVLIPRTWEAL